jgi:hypothetical protein
VEKRGTTACNPLILLRGILAMLCFEEVRLWKECLLSRTWNAYESGLDRVVKSPSLS